MEQSSIVTTHLSTCMEWQKNITHNINRCEKAMSLIVNAAGCYIDTGTQTWKWVDWTVI